MQVERDDQQNTACTSGVVCSQQTSCFPKHDKYTLASVSQAAKQHALHPMQSAR